MARIDLDCRDAVKHQQTKPKKTPWDFKWQITATFQISTVQRNPLHYFTLHYSHCDVCVCESQTKLSNTAHLKLIARLKKLKLNIIIYCQMPLTNHRSPFFGNFPLTVVCAYSLSWCVGKNISWSWRHHSMASLAWFVRNFFEPSHYLQGRIPPSLQGICVETGQINKKYWKKKLSSGY